MIRRRTNQRLYSHAARYLGDLNDRQMDTLRLMAHGRTNGEIAEELGLTLAGAKWNVSEVLTKLGFESRDDAGDFYRWHIAGDKRATRLLRAVTGFGLWKAAAATGVATLVVGLGAGATLHAFGTGEPEQPGLPFSAEIRVTRVEPNMTTEAAGRWWWGDPTHGRTESDTPVVVAVAPGGGSADFGNPGTATQVFDGIYRWQGGAPIYQKDAIPVGANGVPGPQWISGGPALGPLPDVTLDAFIARLTAEYGTARSVRAAGHATILGRDTVVIEARAASGPVATTWWLDPRRLFVMKSAEVRGDGLSRQSVEITRLEYGKAQDAARFSWVAPPGAVENQCNPPVADIVAGSYPAGFLHMDDVAPPIGLSLVVSGMTTGSDGTCSEAHSEFRRPGSTAAPNDPFLQIGQNRERPDSVITGSRNDVRTLAGESVSAFLWHEDTITLLAWVDHGLGVQLKSNSLGEDDIIGVAERLLASGAP